MAKGWGRTYWVYRRLHLVGNDKLDGGGLERVLWIKPHHEVKNLILEKKNPPKFHIRYRWGWERRGAARCGGGGGHEARSRTIALRKSSVAGANGTLYKLSPRTSIEKNHVLRSSACSSWIPVQDGRCALARDYSTAPAKGGGGKARRTHQPLSLRDRPVRSGFLAAPSSIFANRRRTWREVVGGGRGAQLCLGKGLVGTAGPYLCWKGNSVVFFFWVDSTTRRDPQQRTCAFTSRLHYCTAYRSIAHVHVIL